MEKTENPEDFTREDDEGVHTPIRLRSSPRLRTRPSPKHKETAGEHRDTATRTVIEHTNEVHLENKKARQSENCETNRSENGGSVRVAVVALVSYLICIVLAVLGNRAFKEFSQRSSMVENEELFTEDIPMWEFIGTSGSNMIDTYIRKIPGSKLFAFKGAVVIDHHIAEVLNTYGNVETTTDWVDLLQIMETLPLSGESTVEPKLTPKNGFIGGLFGKFKFGKKKQSLEPGREAANNNNNILQDQPYQMVLSDLVYQYYALPWPVSPRDFLFRRDIRLFPAEHSATAQYISTEDSRRPPTSTSTNHSITTRGGRTMSKNTIRAESPFTNWLFQDIDAYCTELRHTMQLSSNSSTGAGAGADKPASHVPLGRGANSHRESYVHANKANIVNICRKRLETQHLSAGDTGVKPDRRTYVEIEALVDNKGSLPAWFVNYVQRSWPSKTLGAFASAVNKRVKTQSTGDYAGALSVIAKW